MEAQAEEHVLAEGAQKELRQLRRVGQRARRKPRLALEERHLPEEGLI